MKKTTHRSKLEADTVVIKSTFCPRFVSRSREVAANSFTYKVLASHDIIAQCSDLTRGIGTIYK